MNSAVDPAYGLLIRSVFPKIRRNDRVARVTKQKHNRHSRKPSEEPEFLQRPCLAAASAGMRYAKGDFQFTEN
jgi:hypothetical protein